MTVGSASCWQYVSWIQVLEDVVDVARMPQRLLLRDIAGRILTLEAKTT